MVKKSNKKNNLSFFKKLSRWFDENFLFIFSTFLLAFIPLYPKIPLFDIIPGYIVRVRFEDILIAVAGLFWVIQIIRKKTTWKSPLTKLISTYALVGLFSLLSAVFIIHTIPLELIHIGKSSLHLLRYLEYFFLFILMYSSINTQKQAKTIIWSILTTVFLISFYGLGQKYWYWPVYSTMNREFSKGIRLYLTEHARVQSTFGGHYDLGAYLLIMLPIILSSAFLSKKKWKKRIFHLVHAFGLWLLIMSASRASFASYGLAMLLVLIFLALKEKTWKKKINSFFKKTLGMGLLTGSLMLAFGGDMSERILQVFDAYPEISNTYHSINAERKKGRDQIYDWMGIIELKPPENSIGFDNTELESVLTATDQQPTTRPSDVYKDIPDLVEIATISADGTKTIIRVERERTWSDNALKYGLSLAIRLDTLWPNAIKGFMKNPLLGSGYATLNKETAYHFTEAESTDNNYLRILGETGLLGFLTFFGIIFISLRYSFKYIFDKDKLKASLAIGLVAGSIGLMANASYIDVYAASKVAFTYWGIVGVILAVLSLPKKKSLLNPDKK
ncbi:MAG: hypothetical protein HN981_04805 [Candidatus Pacebacteria bacterium]|jgi:hypothetical protein|nr:hypothetical protein [Candidatus Paceibacterota bacterium]MBT4652068.1 hypothetical protein [Candidatus Paceibacterota bacterium]MBT6756090.1 hypothetical protein [Candidatus Paceibacterota bacterium]MBT6921683.1 hypothetical protein [Candidatus Paceibacterota bacterium]